MPHERTEELTEYEFDYELELDIAYAEWLREVREADEPISWDQSDGEASFSKGMSTDPELYEDMKTRAERGEYIDFEIPNDEDMPRLSQKLAEMHGVEAEASELEQVDPSDVFGGE